MPSLDQLHQRYLLQATWTAQIRRRLYALAGLGSAKRVLEVGCGTGVIASELAANSPASVCGVDIDVHALDFARREGHPVHLAVGDAISLPIEAGSFDVVVCHFLLLWVEKQGEALAEMVRVTRPGGAVLALAEPDYGGRVDHPKELEPLGPWQEQALQGQGADPRMGRKLRASFVAAGLTDVLSGVLGGEWTGRSADEAFDSEWEMVRSDLQGRVSATDLDALCVADERAWEAGIRVLYVPTFYAFGRVPMYR